MAISQTGFFIEDLRQFARYVEGIEPRSDDWELWQLTCRFGAAAIWDGPIDAFFLKRMRYLENIEAVLNKAYAQLDAEHEDWGLDNRRMQLSLLAAKPATESKLSKEESDFLLLLIRELGLWNVQPEPED